MCLFEILRNNYKFSVNYFYYIFLIFFMLLKKKNPAYCCNWAFPRPLSSISYFPIFIRLISPSPQTVRNPWVTEAHHVHSIVCCLLHCVVVLRQDKWQLLRQLVNITSLWISEVDQFRHVACNSLPDTWCRYPCWSLLLWSYLLRRLHY